MSERKTCNKNDVLALVLKLIIAFAAITAAVIAGIKIYEKIQAKRMCSLCDCCDDEYYDDDLCECDCCDCDDEPEITVEEVTEAEVNPTEE